MTFLQIFMGLLLAAFGSMGSGGNAKAATNGLNDNSPTSADESSNVDASPHGTTPPAPKPGPDPVPAPGDDNGQSDPEPDPAPEPDPDPVDDGNTGHAPAGDGSTDPVPGDSGGSDGGSGGNDGGNDGGNGGGDPLPPPGEITPPEQNSGTGSNSGSVENLTAPADGSPVTVVAGRVATLELENADSVASVRILEGPEAGNVTVNPDNTLAVVLSDTDFTGRLSFSYEVSYADGTTESLTARLDAVPGPQQAGWGLGKFYMLQTDDDDDVVVEYGENHREVYVSGSNDALSLSDIAALEGVNVSQINANWLMQNEEYGSSEDMALDQQAGMMLWRSITGSDTAPSSNWLLLERGYEYDELGRVIERGTEGESELNPVYVGAYGSGDKPVVTSQLRIYQEDSDNVVIQDITFTGGIRALGGSNVLLDDISVTGESGLNIQNFDGFTLRDSDIVDVIREDPTGNTGRWQPGPDRVSGAFFKNIDGLLIENNLVDHSGWAEDYDYNLSADSGQPPGMFSHNIYVQYDSLDVTFRDNIIMRGASYGAQIRPGGLIEDNLFLDNNIGVTFLGGNYLDYGFVGNYSVFADNVITSAGHKTVAEAQGALSWGVVEAAAMSTLVDNIVTHLADPNNPAELADKEFGQPAMQLNGQPAFYNDTIVYNWVGSRNADQIDDRNDNVEGLDTSVLDQTTIQRFAAQLLGQETATISDLADYLRAQADGDLDDVVDADLIIGFFQQGFGLTPDIRSDAETLRFIPDDLGDGMRWDNRLNWNTEDLPGTQDGDSVDLAGNWVYYGGMTSTIDDLDLGSGGRLYVTSGYLGIDGDLTAGAAGAALEIDGAGQFWTDGYATAALLDIDVDGGRFANTGQFYGTTDIEITDNAQAILATDGAAFDLTGTSSMDIVGDDVRVGFDGQGSGPAVLRLGDDATLGFTAENGQLGTIEEFRSGFFGDGAPTLQSGVDLGSATLSLDLTGVAAGSSTLIRVDQIIGTLEEVSVTGLGGNQDVSVVIDYATDTVTVELGQAGSGSGAVDIVTRGDEDFVTGGDAEAQALWDLLTAGQPEPVIPDDIDDAGQDALLLEL